MDHVLWFLSHWLGLDNASGSLYLWWSGFFADLTIFAGAFGLYWHHTCHVGTCWRLGPHPVEGTPYKTCKTHHPKIDHTTAVTVETIHQAHQDAA